MNVLCTNCASNNKYKFHKMMISRFLLCPHCGYSIKVGAIISRIFLVIFSGVVPIMHTVLYADYDMINANNYYYHGIEKPSKLLALLPFIAGILIAIAVLSPLMFFLDCLLNNYIARIKINKKKSSEVQTKSKRVTLLTFWNRREIYCGFEPNDFSRNCGFEPNDFNRICKILQDEKIKYFVRISGMRVSGMRVYSVSVHRNDADKAEWLINKR